MSSSTLPASDGSRARRGSPSGSTVGAAVRLIRYTASVDPRIFSWTVATALLGSLTEGLWLTLLMPLLAVAGMNFSGSSAASRLGTFTEQALVRAGVPHWLWLPVVLTIFLAAGGARSLLRRAQSTLVSATVTRVELQLSRRVYESVVRAQWSFLVRQRAGRLTHVLTEELRQVAYAIALLLGVINFACLIALYLVVAMKLSAAMTLLVLGMGGVLLLLQRSSLGQMRTSGKELAESVAEVYAATDEHLLNLKSVKTYNAEDRDVALFGGLCREVARQAVENAKHQAAAAFRFEMGTMVALGAVIFLALGALHVQSATMLLMLAIFTRLMPQLAALQTQAHQAASYLPSYDHVLAIERDCLVHAEAEANEEAAGAALSLARELRLDGVWFAYQPSGESLDEERHAAPEFVLRGIDLAIEAGTLTAVIGPSGAGKSTIADLVNGLLLPTRGRLVVDGHALDPAGVRAWRRRVGYVGQETVLFHQSVRENLLWAQPGATDEEMHEALTLASAEFVYDLQGGMDTVVGDRGILLSSGQRQRISLARAFLRRPSLLILDEATNALDVENEARVLDGIREAILVSRGVRGEPLTVLMIAHRASAIRRADRIFELEGGRVSRMGTWEELHRADASVALN